MVEETEFPAHQNFHPEQIINWLEEQADEVAKDIMKEGWEDEQELDDLVTQEADSMCSCTWDNLVIAWVYDDGKWDTLGANTLNDLADAVAWQVWKEHIWKALKARGVKEI